ncbi:helix-turn-helix transcriptional regulator [Aestuariivirga sp.]|uniref:helix-turn-helix transcriptional regulator n=1 Tax=Aestuariivirga sp. TaxID=2650926 RepID=UPI003BACB522
MLVALSMANRFDVFNAVQEPFADEAECASFLRTARDRLGVLNLSYWFLGSSSAVPDRMTWYSTYDQTYTAIYMRDFSPLRDRAFQLSFTRLLPLDWEEARAGDQTVEHIHQLAERFGIGRHGISIPIRDTGLGDALFSINFDCDSVQWGQLRREMANEAHLFGHYYHQRMKRLLGAPAPSTAFDLSPREREVLQWAAEGMTAGQTARLLKVSESAVNLYAARAMSKLRARTKTQAVAIAVRNKLLQ